MNFKSERLWSIILAVIVVGLVIFIWMARSASASQISWNEDNCHWVGEGKSRHWVCTTPTPTPTPKPTPTATPSATPTPFDFLRDSTDLCTNWAGIQSKVPDGAFLNDKTECQNLVEPTPAPQPVITAATLPATGDNSLVTYLAIVLGLIGLGTIGSVWASKKLKD